MEHEFAGCRGRVDDAVTYRLESHPALPQALDQINQVSQRASQAIQTPHQQSVARPQSLKTPFQAGPCCLRAASLVGVYVGFGGPGVFQRVELQLKFLSIGADASVADQLLR